jgi:hypothetical protein
VSAAGAGAFSLSATPASISIAPGSTAVYSLLIARHDFADAIDLDVTGAPKWAEAIVGPTHTTGSSATLTVATTDAVQDGTYPLDLVASSGGRRAYAQVQLVVDSKVSGKPFTLSGGPVGQLAPGAPALPIDLAISNPNNQPLAITNISVTVSGTDRPGCAAANYAVTQYAGPYPLTVPRGSARTLSELGVARSDLPTVRMLDLAHNQDACKSAVVTLAYSGSARGN